MDTRLKTASMFLLAAAFSAFTVGCGSPEMTPRESMALAGGVIGAGTGALVGSATGPGAAIGAGIGGGIGLVGGAAVGDEIEIIDAKNDQNMTLLESQERDIEAQRREMDQVKLQQERDEIQDQTQTRTTTIIR
jgi:osmotically inducible lipoprotein OsmB